MQKIGKDKYDFTTIGKILETFVEDGVWNGSK